MIINIATLAIRERNMMVETTKVLIIQVLCVKLMYIERKLNKLLYNYCNYI